MKILKWGGIAFVIFFIAFRPGDAANVLKVLGATAVDVLSGVGDFFSALVN